MSEYTMTGGDGSPIGLRFLSREERGLAPLPTDEDVAKLVAWAQDAAVILTVAKDAGIRISRLNEIVASADSVLAPWRKL